MHGIAIIAGSEAGSSLRTRRVKQSRQGTPRTGLLRSARNDRQPVRNDNGDCHCE
ncbi:MAG: hypothetical protein LBT00_14845 [Spirochaetaceae bacterium]|nr:hypothetical protein [Spirochaetaceae bacterium]